MALHVPPARRCCHRLRSLADPSSTKAPGRKIRAGSKRAFRRSITTWPGTSPGHGRRPSRRRRARCRARGERLAERRDLARIVEREPREPERGARDDRRAGGVGGADHVRQVGRAAGDLQHDRAALQRADVAPVDVGDVARRGSRLLDAPPRPRTASGGGRGRRARRRRSSRPRAGARASSQHLGQQLVRVVASSDDGRGRVGQRVQPHGDATRSGRASRRSPRTASPGHSPRRS